MTNHKNKFKHDGQDEANRPYDVDYFREKHGLSQDAARKIIEDTRGNRKRADEMAQRWKK